MPSYRLNSNSSLATSGANQLNVINSGFLISENTTVLYSSSNKYVNQILYVDQTYWAKINLLSRVTLPNNLLYLVDGAQFTSKGNITTFYYNYSSFSLDIRYSVYTSINSQNFQLLSISSIFSSSLWLERELSDFTNIFFCGLYDTRRLLIDYFQEKKYYVSHSKEFRSFSNFYYEVVINY